MSVRNWYKDTGGNESPIGGTPPLPEEYQQPVNFGSLVDQNGRPVPVMGQGKEIPFNGVPTQQTDALSVSGAARFYQPSQTGELVASSTAKSLPRGIRPARGPRVRFYDPLSLIYATGFRDRRFSLTYDTLRRTSYQLSLVNAIILTRVNQMSAFAQPYRENKQIGFEIRFKDDLYTPTEEEEAHVKRLEQFMMDCGWDENPYSPFPRDDFETFIKKIVRDSYTYDQLCAVAGTWVEMGNGTGLPIESIEEGMFVRTHTGEVREVVAPKRRSYSGEMCVVRVRGQELEVTAGHPILVAKRTSCRGNTVEVSSPTWEAARDVKSGMYVVYPRPLLKNEDCFLELFKEEPRKFFNGDLGAFAEECGVHRKTAHLILTGKYQKNGSKKDLVEKMALEKGMKFEYKRRWEPSTRVDEDWGRFLGLYVAEGCVQGNTVRLTFHEEEEHLVSFVCFFAEEFGISSSVINYKERRGVTVLLSSQVLATFLNSSCGTGSSNKKVPLCIIDSIPSVKDAFLAAYFEGDGCLQENKCSFSTVSRDLFTGVRLLLAEKGIYVAEIVIPPFKDGWSVQYSGNVSGKAYREFALNQGFPVNDEKSLRRSFLADKRFLYVKVDRVDHYEADGIPVFNMEVEDDHSYIAQGFVNHNCFEVVPDEQGRPFEFRGVDAATIRLAATYDNYRGAEPRRFKVKDFTERWQKDYGEDFEFAGDGVYTVQVIHGRIENIFTKNDMAFCIRNPRTDLWVNGYGFGEIEMCLNTVTRMLWAEEYNARVFKQGSMANGILNLKGENYDPGQLEAFRRIWQAQVTGVENSHKLPIIQIPEGVEFVNMQRGNKEMEYKAWLDYLLKIVSGTFQIDPSEVNFDLVSGAGGGAGPLFESKHEWKIKYSKDKGLRPMLKFLAKQLSKYIIDPLDSRLYLDFVGLDQVTESDRVELITRKVTSYQTLNEARVKESLDPVEGGDIILNPIYLQSLQQAMQAQQMGMDTGPASANNPLAPWLTEEDVLIDYGNSPALPLTMQEGEAEQVQPPMPPQPDMGGPPMGGPPMPGPPGGPPPGMPPGPGGMPPGGAPPGVM